MYKDKYLENDTINLLKNNKEIFALIQSSDDQTKKIVDDLEIYFPIFSWGKINWTLIENSISFTEYDGEKIAEIITEICKQHSLQDDVYIIWSNALNPIINIKLNTALNYLEDIIYEDCDVWIVSTSFKWCIEVYHEGEVSFGYSQLFKMEIKIDEYKTSNFCT